jgi:hypothetical protein
VATIQLATSKAYAMYLYTHVPVILATDMTAAANEHVLVNEGLLSTLWFVRIICSLVPSLSQQ